MPKYTNVAVRVYSNRSYVKEQNCRDSKLLVPLKKLNQFELLSRIHAIVQRGKTTIAYSLAKVQQDLQGAQGARVVLLITEIVKSVGFKVNFNLVAERLRLLQQWGSVTFFLLELQPGTLIPCQNVFSAFYGVLDDLELTLSLFCAICSF